QPGQRGGDRQDNHVQTYRPCDAKPAQKCESPRKCYDRESQNVGRGPPPCTGQPDVQGKRFGDETPRRACLHKNRQGTGYLPPTHTPSTSLAAPQSVPSRRSSLPLYFLLPRRDALS